MNIINITNLFRAFLIESKKGLLIGCALTFGIAVLLYSVSVAQEIGLTWVYYALFFVVAFSPFGFMKNRAHFFTLPANTAERFIYVLLVIVVLGILFHLLALAGAYLGAYLIQPLIYSGANSYLFSEVNIFKNNLWSWKEYLDFVTLLSPFLFGTIYFKKSAFFKTFGIAMGFLFAIALYFLALVYIIFGNMAFFDDAIQINIANSSFLQNYEYIFNILIAVFFLSLTYLRLRETEV